MYVFLLILVPLVYFVTEYICHERKIDREHAFCIFWGFVIACIYCLIDFFAVGVSHEWVNSPSVVWGHYLITETILPVFVCFIPVIAARDSIRVKIKYLFPILAAFMTVFLPYKVMTSSVSPDFFGMILYPLMMAAMLFNVDTGITLFDSDADMKNLLWLRCVIVFFAVASGLLLPSVFQAFYYLKLADAGTYILIAVYVLGSAGFRTLEKFFLS